MRNKLKGVTNKGSSLVKKAASALKGFKNKPSSFVTKAASTLKRLGNQAYDTKTGKKIGNKVYSKSMGKRVVNWFTKKNKGQVKVNALNELPTGTHEINLPKTGKKATALKNEGNLGLKEQSVAAYVKGYVDPFALAYEAQNRAQNVEQGKVLYRNMNKIEREGLKVKGEQSQIASSKKLAKEYYMNVFGSGEIYPKAVQEYKQHMINKYGATPFFENINVDTFQAWNLDPKKKEEFNSIFERLKREEAEQMRRAMEPVAPRLQISPPMSRENRVKKLKREITPAPNMTPPPIPAWARSVYNDNDNSMVPPPSPNENNPSSVRSSFAPTPTKDNRWGYGRV